MLPVRPGEGRLVLLLQLQIFLIIGVLLIAKPAGNAIFLARFGSAALPYVFILTAFVAIVVSTAYSQALKYFTVLRLNLWSLGVCMALSLGFALMVPVPELRDTLAIGLYLWIALFGVLAASQFWMIASMALDVRQAKRLFGLIGAGAIAGGITGGYLATLIANAYGVKALLYTATVMLLPVMLISFHLWRKYIRVKGAAMARKKKTAALRESPHRLILQRKHLMLLCGIIALSVITAKLVDYQFSALASARFSDEDRLTAFFGFWFSTFNVIGLFIQLLLTQRIVQHMGVSGSLLFLPVGLGVSAILMFILPGLNTAILSRLIDGSLKQSLHRAGVEMQFLPVPTVVKERIKTYIDVLIDSIAGGIGGLLLLLLVEGLRVSVVTISILILVLSIIWVVCIFSIREEYLDAFRSQLQHLRPRHRRRKKSTPPHKEVLSSFLKILANADHAPDDRQLLYVLERSNDLADPKLCALIINLLDHSSPAIRAQALRSLTNQPAPNLLLRVVPLLVDEDVRVRNAAIGYCISKHLPETEEIIREQLKDPDPDVSGTVLVQMLVETRGNPSMRRNWKLDEEFTFRVNELRWISGANAVRWRLKLLLAAGQSGSKLGKDFITQSLESEQLQVVLAAINAAGDSHDDRYLLRLIAYLADAQFRDHAGAALARYGLGLVATLPALFKRRLIDIESARALPSVLERINSQQTVELLFGIIERYYPEDLQFRLKVMKSLNAMQRDFPELQFLPRRVNRLILAESRLCQLTLRCLKNQLAQLNDSEGELRRARQALVKLLRRRVQGSMERLFRLLGLRYSPDDIIPIYRGLVAKTKQEQSSAIEFLDTLLDQGIKPHVVPLVELELRLREEDILHSTASRAELLALQFVSFKRIVRGTDLRLKLSVIKLVGLLGEERYMPSLRLLLTAEDQRIREMAGQSFDRILNASLATVGLSQRR